jgi:hypothetical protein
MSSTETVLERMQRWPLAIGAVALVLCAWGAYSNVQQFLRSYLLAYIFWSGVALGCLAVLMLYHLVGGGWGVLIRRTLEAGTRTIPLVALLIVPVLAGIPHLYAWAHPEVVALDEHLRHKSGYLNVPFFLIRTVVYFAVWAGLAFFLNRWSSQQDRGGSPLLERRLHNLSGPGLVLFVVTVTFASLDWVMSLEPDWYSTIYSALFMVGQVLSALAFVLALLGLLASRTALGEVLSARYLRDLGNLLLTFVILWAYMAFSQFLIIWAGNLSEEIPWYIRRIKGGWEWVAGFVIVFHFALPFLLLLSREVKHRVKVLAGLAAALLVARLVCGFWMVAPAFGETSPRFHWLDWVAPVGIGGVWLAAFAWQLKRRPLLPLHDPNLRELFQSAGGASH